MQEKGGDKMSGTGEHFDAKNPHTATEDDDDELVESDIELDVTDVVEPDNDPPQKVGGIKNWLRMLRPDIFACFIMNYSSDY